MNNIVEVLQDYIDVIVEDEYGHDKCKPKFKIFNVYDGTTDNNQVLIITVEHLGSQIGRFLYPNTDEFYGNEVIRDIVISLYNQTM